MSNRRALKWGMIAFIVLGMLGLGCSDDDPHGLGTAGSSGTPGTAGGSSPAGQGAAGMKNDPQGTAGGSMNAADGGNTVVDAGASDASEPPLAMDECGLHTKYAGDEYCILPPPPDKGFQIHIGPSDYDNPEAKYLLGPQQEATTDFATVSGNDKPIYFYYRQFRQRPGAHHNIVTSADGGGFGMGRRIATSNNLAEDNPKGGVIAPENVGVGIPLSANSKINVSLHSINVTSETQLREVWINFWYRDPEEVTEPVEEMFQTGDVSFKIPAHADTILGPFQCKPKGAGRILWFYGHRHANNVRFSAWRIRGQKRELFYEANDREEPLLLEYTSTVKNTPADTQNGVEGGWSGVLDLLPGDVLEWECHVINKTDGVLRFTNNTYTGEMCIMDAELVGTNCP